VYSNIEATHLDAISLAANLNGDAVEVRNCNSGAMVLVWSGASATDAVVKLQESMDQTTWVDIATQTKTLNAASGSNVFKLTMDVLKLPYIRAVLAKNSETTGTATIKYLFKGDR
jgi:hypothetical protein